MATIAAEMMLRCATDCSLSLNDFDVERWPYHKNCGSALHRLKEVCSHACSKQNSAPFSKKKSWPDCSLSTISCQASYSTVSALSPFTFREDAIANEVLSGTNGHSN